jgi:hypothetical protein
MLASRTGCALGELARCRALLAPDDGAELEYRLAGEHLQRCRITPQLGRTQLLYGEWLHRRRRSRDARDEFRTAFGMFDAMAMDAFISTHTVEYHLVKVFHKLDITNRAQLARALAGQDESGGVSYAVPSPS